MDRQFPDLGWRAVGKVASEADSLLRKNATDEAFEITSGFGELRWWD